MRSITARVETANGFDERLAKPEHSGHCGDSAGVTRKIQFPDVDDTPAVRPVAGLLDGPADEPRRVARRVSII